MRGSNTMDQMRATVAGTEHKPIPYAVLTGANGLALGLPKQSVQRSCHFRKNQRCDVDFPCIHTPCTPIYGIEASPRRDLKGATISKRRDNYDHHRYYGLCRCARRSVLQCLIGIGTSRNGE